MRRVVGTESTGEELCGKEFEVLVYCENFGFGVEVGRRGFFVAAQTDPEGLVLDDLEFLDVGRCGRRVPDWGCVVEDMADEVIVGIKQGLCLITPA